MNLEERVKALEERLEIVEAGGVWFQRKIREWSEELTGHIDEKVSELTKVMLSVNAQMKTWNNDLEKHFESHNLDKKKKEEYASKRRKTKY